MFKPEDTYVDIKKEYKLHIYHSSGFFSHILISCNHTFKIHQVRLVSYMQ